MPYIFLLTLHRQENVDNPKQLIKFINLLLTIIKKYNSKKIIWPIHPRTKNLINILKINLDNKIILTKPVNFFDFVKLENNSFCILTDSGTVQEECSILKVPCIVLRKSTERQETVESGSTLINYDNEFSICENIKFITGDKKTNDSIPDEYLVKNVSERIVNLLISYHNF